jgi:hypothetical protein
VPYLPPRGCNSTSYMPCPEGGHRGVRLCAACLRTCTAWGSARIGHRDTDLCAACTICALVLLGGSARVSHRGTGLRAACCTVCAPALLGAVPAPYG